MVLTDAIEAILGVPRVFLSVVLKGCVSWAKENGVEIFAVDCKVTENGIFADAPIPVCFSE